MKKVVVCVTGASGAIYAKVLFERLLEIKLQWDDVAVVFSSKGREVWEYELGERVENIPFKRFDRDNFYAPFASGSSDYDVAIVCPCTMGTMGRIAHGVSDDLITRTADVMLKERRKLILVARDTPYSLIHINNMKLLTEAGAIICPASPSFYSRPTDIRELVLTVVDRVLVLAGFQLDTYRWNS
ncbi:MAG: UbiX family flavin prenyltransferase [Bacteroidota bacterium]|nr:UbiX family flavin prenyltransferase [Bacteroidota bacterium]